MTSRRTSAGLLVVLGLLVLSGLLARGLVRERAAVRRRVGATAEVPPALAFANVALGGFRGTIADLLWLRAQRLQEAGRYVELVPLAEGIAALEPDNGEVWAYHAWNLSFNVCAMASRPEDRWRWVRAGLDLLEKRGTRLNPLDARTRRELAWIFLFKLGTDVDFAAGFYRAEWARGIAPLLGPDGAPPAIPSSAAARLADDYGLDAARMAALDGQFGPIDWRVPGSHALYWAAEGLARAGEREDLACRRGTYQALVQMIQNGGRVRGDPESPDYQGDREPNHALLDGTLVFLRETAALHPTHGVRTALTALLLDAVRIEGKQGRTEGARERYREFAASFEPETVLPSFEDVIAGRVEFRALPWERLLAISPQ